MSMMMRGCAARASRGVAREIGIWPLIVWAFRNECAQLEFDDGRTEPTAGFGYASMTSIIAQHEQLGCRVDGGGRSDPHPDADIVASALSVLPEGCGGKRMALVMVDLARSGAMPEWAVRTAIEPRCMIRKRYGCHAETDDARHLGAQGWQPTERRNRRGAVVLETVRYCPVTVRGDAAEIAAKRRAYLLWWSALLELRSTLQIGGDLSAWRVTDAMPARQPWQTGSLSAVV